jgi:Lon protease-like protein
VATRLPLFPLSTVLVPGLVLPLPVFEPRYRILVQALLELPEDAERRFGVVATRSGRQVDVDGARALYGMGCTAELREVTSHPDGRYDLVTVGETRFRLLGLDKGAGTPYHTGFVEFVAEEDGDGDVGALAERVTERFADYRERLGVEVTELPDQPQVISYLVAAAVVLDLPQRQGLLEQPTTSDRLRAEIGLLRRESAMINAFRSLPAVDLAGETWSRN